MTRPMVYDRQGQPISMERWNELLMDRAYKQVSGWVHVGDHVRVSTVWLGLDHRHSGDGPPLIFETMVFTRSRTAIDWFPWRDVLMMRTATEAEARIAHEVLLADAIVLAAEHIRFTRRTERRWRIAYNKLRRSRPSNKRWPRYPL